MKNFNGSWKPSDVAYLKEFNLVSDTLTIAFICQSREKNGWPNHSEEFFQAVIQFDAVSNLHLTVAGSRFQDVGTLYQIMGFDIIDVSADQLEVIRFKIEDYEDGYINFYCRSISVQSVSAPFFIEPLVN